jgi:hypothetical protein
MAKRHRRRRALGRGAQAPILRTTIQQPVPDFNLNEEATIAVRHGGSVHKVVKFVLPARSADFYIALPYLSRAVQSCGLRDDEGRESLTFSSESDVAIPDGPLKMSFHESGQQHFKAQSAEVDARLPLVQIQGTPLAEMHGEHAFTIEIEGLDAFRKAKDRELVDPSLMIYVPSQDVVRFRIVGFIGSSLDEVSHKYTVAGTSIPPTFHITLNRPTLSASVVIGLYCQEGDTLQQNTPVPSALALAGFVRGRESTRFLFLRAQAKT